MQLSMLLLPTTTRANFWVMKFSSLVAFEQLKSPNVVGPCASIAARKPAGGPVERLVPAGWAKLTGLPVSVAYERLREPDVGLGHARSLRCVVWLDALLARVARV